VPEIDFATSQLAKEDARNLTQKIGERALLGLVFISLFAVFLVGLSIENAFLLIGYMAVVTVAIIFARRSPKVDAKFQTMLSRDRKFSLVVIALLAVSYPVLLSGNPYLIHVGAIAGIFVIMALGLNITLGYAGLLDVGFAVYFAAGAYTSAQLAVLYDVPFWIGMPAGGLVAALFGFLIAWPSLRVQGHYLAMVTLGYGMIMNILHRNLKFLTNGTDGIINIPAPAIGGVDFFTPLSLFGYELPFQANFYYLTIALIAVTIFVSYRLKNSNIGRCWEAIREDEIAAKCFGINLTRLKILAFATGAFFGGIGGSVFAHMIGFIHPDNFMLLTSITILAMVLIGGMGNMWGVILGGVLLIMVPERLRDFENLRMLLFGASMALIMIYRPQGLFPGRRRRREVETEKMNRLIEGSGKADSHARPVT